MLKNKIIEILIAHQPKEIMRDGSTAGFVQYTEYGLIAYEIELLVNQEVEKRIAERMPSEEEQDKWADYVAGNTTADHNMAVLYKAALSLGATWLRSHMISSEKPNNSSNDSQKQTHQVTPQVPLKTEGGTK